MNLSKKNYSIRGLLIILVVLGHLLTKNPNFYGKHTIYLVIYTFHMPLFFILSGYYGYSVIYKTNWQICKTTFTKLFVPFLIVSYLYMFVSHLLFNTSFRLNIIESPVFAMWFMLALIFYRLVTRYVIRIPHYLILLALVSIFSDYFPQMLLNNCDFPRILNFMIYFFIGIKLKEVNFDLSRLRLKSFYVVILGVASVLIIASVDYNSTAKLLRQTDVEYFRSLALNQYILYKILAMIFAIVNSILIYNIVIESDRLEKIGKISLNIYLSHVFFILILKSQHYIDFMGNRSTLEIIFVILLELSFVIFANLKFAEILESRKINKV